MSDLKEIGKHAYACIAEMVAALECEYDRLDELKDSESLDDAEKEELEELLEAADDCKNRDEALEVIQDDALSVEVRSGWGAVGDCLQAEEFMILIATGGPAVRIRGELDEHRQPARAWLEVQDRGTPWTRYFDASQDVLLSYARCFYFGD
jgi:hypothetical protein